MTDRTCKLTSPLWPPCIRGSSQPHFYYRHVHNNLHIHRRHIYALHIYTITSTTTITSTCFTSKYFHPPPLIQPQITKPHQPTILISPHAKFLPKNHALTNHLRTNPPPPNLPFNTPPPNLPSNPPPTNHP